MQTLKIEIEITLPKDVKLTEVDKSRLAADVAKTLLDNPVPIYLKKKA
jgi:hypothetical protein